MTIDSRDINSVISQHKSLNKILIVNHFKDYSVHILNHFTITAQTLEEVELFSDEAHIRVNTS